MINVIFKLKGLIYQSVDMDLELSNRYSCVKHDT